MHCSPTGWCCPPCCCCSAWWAIRSCMPIAIAFTNRVVGNAGQMGRAWPTSATCVALARLQGRGGEHDRAHRRRRAIAAKLLHRPVARPPGQPAAAGARRCSASILMLPWALPAFVVFLTWRVLYQPIGGGINLVLTARLASGRTSSTGSAQRATAMPAVIAATVWRGFPFWFVSDPGRPPDHPRRAIRGRAGRWRQRRGSGFAPSRSPASASVVIVTALLSSIWTANAFENVWLLTQGGPSDATMVFPVLAYFGMQTQQLGQAAAVSVAMLPVLAILVWAATAMAQRGPPRSDRASISAVPARAGSTRPPMPCCLHWPVACIGPVPGLLDGRDLAEAATRHPAHALAVAARVHARTTTASCSVDERLPAQRSATASIVSASGDRDRAGGLVPGRLLDRALPHAAAAARSDG